jgi:glycosyltransferase involved in cell wall biosynthesis
MRISIVTPCYNAEKYISDTIESVVYQRGNFEIEYIIVDGASVDRTISIIKKYQEALNVGTIKIRCNKVNIILISEKDLGMYDALVKGFKLVTGDIVGYINSDDFYLPNSFSVISDIFKKYPQVNWLTGMPVSYNEKGQITGCFLPYKYSINLIRKGIYGSILPFIQQESTFWRTNLLYLIDFECLKRYKFAGDFYIWYTFANANVKLFIVQSCLSGFRIRENQLSQKHESEYYKEFYSIAEKTTFIDIIEAYKQKFFTYLPNRMKRKLNDEIIYYDNNTNNWVLDCRSSIDPR